MQIWSAEIKELESLFSSIKGKVPELEKELEQLIKFDDANVILLYSRRCLEIIVTDLCESELKRPRGTEPLKSIIDKLNKEKKVPSHIITSMHGLNDLSTYGTHPKEFDPEQVRPILLNLATIIKWYVKYKDTQIISQTKPEEAKYESKELVDVKESIRKPKKNLILLLSGLLLVVAIVVGALFVFNIIGGGEQNKEPEKSIAVLPFENLSSDEEQAWFSDGITDVIINQLSKISDLRVLGRTSTLKYKEEKKSISEIGEELRVNFLIEGTVQRQENEMRISVQLIQVLNEDHIWSDLYDREWKDIFDVQSDIAQRIAEELKTVLSPEEIEKIKKESTNNPEAYNLYLQGRFHWQKRTEEGLKKSMEYFNEAIAVDPDYALSYTGLADAYHIQAWYGWVPWIEGFTKAKDCALKALDIDNNLAEAHAVLGAVLFWSDWNFEKALKELLLAIELNPNYASAHQYYSELLDILRQNDEARLHINIAMELDPFWFLYHRLSAYYYYDEGKFKESLDEFHILQEINPDDPGAYWGPFSIYVMQGEDLKAVEALQKCMLLDSSTAKYKDVVKEVYSKSGINGLLNFLIELEFNKPIPSSYSFARWYAMLEKKEEALDWLEKALEENNNSILYINNRPDFNVLHSEPRFQAMIKKMGLSEY
jgi:TolB-like protein/Tfp pilus assembly protein PilF